MSNLNEEQISAVNEALTMLAADNPDKKPNVKDVEGVVGFDITADDRDELWADLKAAADSDEAEDSSEDEADPDAVIVTNHRNGPTVINDVSIPAGKSAPVPNFDAEKPIIKLWLEAEVISVG